MRLLAWKAATLVDTNGTKADRIGDCFSGVASLNAEDGEDLVEKARVVEARLQACLSTEGLIAAAIARDTRDRSGEESTGVGGVVCGSSKSPA